MARHNSKLEQDLGALRSQVSALLVDTGACQQTVKSTESAKRVLEEKLSTAVAELLVQSR